ncbi:ABC transporter permease [Enterovibrio calviensis]|uniref:ABC transporter permease n=1 Tax=Enterovibrio calviensis TaxID=91359 RepID=UPI000482CFED|nr:ABC transporter permease [Enterovibrio calviensis]
MLNNYNFLRPSLVERSLISTLAKRDISARYKNSLIGIVWSFAHPLFMLVIYTFVFQYIFKAKWGGTQEVNASFASILFSGLIIHMLFAEVISRSTTVIVGNVNYVKKIVFPLETLCWSLILSSLVQFACGLGILFLFLLVSGSPVHAGIIAIPLVMLPMVIMLVGLSYLLAALTVFIRDLEQVIHVMVTVVLFTSTVFFPLDMVPSIIAPLIKVNPITIPVEAVRSLVFDISPLNYKDLAIYAVVSTVFAALSYRLFNFLKPTFADVI